jgi:hypothetical protein
LHISTRDSVQIVQKKKNLKFWHERFSHLKEQKLRFLVQKNLITSMDVRTNHQLDLCGGYVNGRLCKIFFQKGDPKKMLKTFIELVHTYLCGLKKITLVGRAQFFMTFIDDNTMMVWAHFLKQKLKALVAFKEFQTMVETNLRKKIKSIQNDNADEFIFKTFKGHCKAKGIQIQFTPPYSPQSNGVVEKLN